MKITDKKTELKCRFYELNPGDVFMYEDDVYIRIDRVTDYCYRTLNALNF